MQDFEPYFCTFDGCESPFDIPNSFEGLVDHMQSHLPMQHHIDEPNREHKDVTELEFEHDVKTHGGLSPGPLDVMKESSRRKLAYMFDSCPFCGGYPDIIEKRFPDPDTIDAQVELRNHIKQHMQEIALFLPPYRSDIFEQDDDSKKSDATHRRSSPDDVGTEKDDFVLVCDREDCDCKASSNVGSEDLPTPEPRTETNPGVEPRWTCCLCGNNYKGPAMHKTCTYQRCNKHQPCQNCDRYEYDYSHEGDWPFWLGANSVYARSMSTYDEQLSDERLHPFILHFALYDPRDHLVYRSLEGTPNERPGIVRDLIKSYTRLHYQNLGDNSQPRLPSTDPVIHLERRLLSKNEEDPKSSWKLEDREICFEDITPRHGDHFPEEVDQNDRTEATFRGLPVWIEWIELDDSQAPTSMTLLQARKIVSTYTQLYHSGSIRSWHVPPCYGYFVDDDNYRSGVVLGKPLHVDPEAAPVTLHEVLTTVYHNKPSIAERLQIMRSVHEALESIHDMGFTHQAFCSDSLFFFRDQVNKDAKLLDLYISGFGFSLIVSDDDDKTIDRPPEDPRLVFYRHPTLTLAGDRHYRGYDKPRSSGFPESNDLFALGVVLLELALWKPIEVIMDVDLRHLTHVLVARQKMSSNTDAEVWARVSNELGDVAVDAIRACLKGVKIKWPGTDEREYLSARSVHHVPLPGMPREASETTLHQCMRDLQVTDPREDLARIEGDRDKLLRDCYAWILEDVSFQRWKMQDASRLLWIKGDPGKGKTMMTMGVIAELSRKSADRVSTKTVPKATSKTLGTLRLNSGPSLLAYFFCQSTRPALNNAVSVLRGLLYLLGTQRKELMRHVQKRYETVGRQLFEGPNAIYALREILSDVLNDVALPPTYLLVDALDECTLGLSELLHIITNASRGRRSRVKWLVTSRNTPGIERYLQPDAFGVKISLEVSASHVSKAVAAFVDYKVQWLANVKQYDPGLRAEVQKQLRDKAEGTFLWVSMVCKELEKVEYYRTREVLKALPPGLDPLYDRMMAQVLAQDVRTVGYCRSILRAAALEFRPLQLGELAVAASLPRDQFGDLQAVLDLLSRCGSFLTIREGVVSFIHPSARDYFTVDNGWRAGLLTGLDPLNDQIAMPAYDSSVASRRSQDLPTIFDSSSFGMMWGRSPGETTHPGPITFDGHFLGEKYETPARDPTVPAIAQAVPPRDTKNVALLACSSTV
jgi:hypothetical protein